MSERCAFTEAAKAVTPVGFQCARLGVSTSATQRSLATLEWIDRHIENLVVCGPSGTGRVSSSKRSVTPPSAATASSAARSTMRKIRMLRRA